MSESQSPISKDPRFRDLMQDLDIAIQSIKVYTEQWSKEHGDSPVPDSQGSIITGWSLCVAIAFLDEDGEDFNDDLLTYNNRGLNHYQQVGMLNEQIRILTEGEWADDDS